MYFETHFLVRKVRMFLYSEVFEVDRYRVTACESVDASQCSVLPRGPLMCHCTDGTDSIPSIDSQ